MEVSLCCHRLLFPRQHFLLVKAVAVIHIFQIKLKLIIVGNGDVGTDEGTLVVVEALAGERIRSRAYDTTNTLITRSISEYTCEKESTRNPIHSRYSTEMTILGLYVDNTEKESCELD